MGEAAVRSVNELYLPGLGSRWPRADTIWGRTSLPQGENPKCIPSGGRAGRMGPGGEAGKWASLARRITDCNSSGGPIPADLGEEFAGQVRVRCRISVCGRRIPYDDAEDLTQDIFKRLWEALPRFRGPRGGDSLFLWVRVTIANSMNTYLAEKAKDPTRAVDEILRRLGRSADIDDLIGSLRPGEVAGQSSEEYAIAQDLRERLCAALLRLPDQQRRAWLMHHVSGLAFCEIAGILEMTEDAAKMAASRATKALQRVLDEYDGSEPVRAARVGEGSHEKR
jgi:RNA polymerase sigma factor (sigma-70 family)